MKIKKEIGIIPTHRTCTMCRQTLEIGNFGARKKGSFGYKSECRSCQKMRSLERAGDKELLGACKSCNKPRLPGMQYCLDHWFRSQGSTQLGNYSVETGNLLREKLENQQHKCPYTGK